ncbi:MAG: hypothetical protein GY868_14880, partial [Deltaproteobacteria bacterium]|nr:hypothetical protein [Deltaproteobacteria bacterium]
PFPADLDLRQQEQTLVVGISDRHYSRSVSEAENRLLMLLCFGSFSIIIFLGAWCLAIRNRSLAEALTASHAREAHLEELGLSAAGLAHETKNPLGIIRGLAQRISKGNMPKQEINKITESIMNEVDTAGARLNMFMAYAKSKTPQLKPLEAGKFLKRIAGLLEPDCAAAGLTLTASAAPDFILADSDMLQQILVNLILNSLQASDAGSRIMVNIKSSGAKATLIVKDQGRGIPNEIKSDIFKPYTSGRSGGHGLGLAIVNRIVEDHGWTIDAKPAPEGGTVINISGIAVAANGEYD